MKEFIILIFCCILVIGGLWLAGHETPAQEIITSIILLLVSIIAIFASLKLLSSESSQRND